MKKLPRLYCDMDGVLCDFVKQAEKATGMSIDAWMKEPKKNFKSIRGKWQPVKDYPRFWKTMPWNTGAKQLWSYIKKFQPHILSAYVEQTTDPSCIPGKTKWVQRNLGIPRSRVNLVKRVEKQNYTNYNGQPTVLIDDYEKNILQFKARGGIAILHKNTNDTIRQLKALGYK